MSVVINWSRSGTFGITPRGYEICRSELSGSPIWNVFNAYGGLIGSYADLDLAKAAVR